jgi:hypothetical protein
MAWIGSMQVTLAWKHCALSHVGCCRPGNFPAGEEVPASNRRCNTVACPQATFQVLTGQHSTCRTHTDCEVVPSAADGAHLSCINSIG